MKELEAYVFGRLTEESRTFPDDDRTDAESELIKQSRRAGVPERA
jgi:hypothetical protein